MESAQSVILLFFVTCMRGSLPQNLDEGVSPFGRRPLRYFVAAEPAPLPRTS